MSLIHAPVSAGELIDKITILEIKAERISGAAKVANIRHELSLLENICKTYVANDASVSSYRKQLKRVNEALWEIEDNIRLKEKTATFDDEFIQLARAVYVTNDKRSVLKRRINEHAGSVIIEEKSYSDYSS